MKKPIEDTKISLETAKLAKEKKFDAIVKGSITEYLNTKIDKDYPEGGGSFGWKKGELEGDDGYFSNFSNSSDYSNKNFIMYARPTQTVLQRWFREIHEIEVFIKPFTIPQLNRKGSIKYYGLVMTVDCVGDCNASTECKDKYEDAMEDALMLAFKFIK